MSSLTKTVALAVGLVAASIPAHALVVAGYDSTINNRYDSGFPSSPVPNTDSQFLLSGMDLSGVGWETNNTSFGVTMISPQHFVTAAHVANGLTSVSFLGGDGNVHTYSVSSISHVQYSEGVNTDIVVGTLAAPVAASDQITYYPTVLLNSANDYLNINVVMFGASGKVGLNSIDALGNADMLPFGGGDGTNDSVVSVMNYDAATGEAQAQGGDSGSPTFAVINGSMLGILAVHSAINSNPPPEQTYDSFLPVYYNQINNIIQGNSIYTWSGYVNGVSSISSVPEPSTYGLFGGLAVLSCSAFRRRRRQIQT